MMTAVRPQPRRQFRTRKTAAWTIAKLFLFAAFVGLASAVYLGWKPVVNPGVQDCGSPFAFFMSSRENVILHPGEPGAPANAVVLGSQPTCRELSSVEIQKAAVGLAAFFVLGLAGIVIGLVDDRVEYWKAPNYETLLKPMPREAKIQFGLEPKVTVEDLGSTLPPLESPEIWGIVLIGALTFVALPFAGPIEATRAAWSDAGFGWLLLAAVLTFGLFVAAAAQRRAVYPKSESWRRLIQIVFAAAFAGRLRPVVGSSGIDIYRLRKLGSTRDDAVLDARVLQSVSLLAHVLLLGIATLATVSTLRRHPELHRPQWVLAGVLGLVLLSGLERLPRRIRALAVRPSFAGLRGIPKVAPNPERIAILVVGTLGITVLSVLVLSASLATVGGTASFVTLLFVVLASVTVGSMATTPNGLGVFEATMALLLMLVGVDPGAAILATLLFRILTLWLPMLAGWRTARALQSINAL